MRRSAVVRFVVVGLIALPLAWMAMALSLSLLLSRTDPGFALRLWSNNSLAHAALADELLADAPTAPPPEARRQAIEALHEEPGNPMAARVIGLAIGSEASGNVSDLQRWLAYSERYSRRDAGAQFGLIELAVSRGQIVGVLVHYDRALRVFTPLPQLIDVLVGATSEAPVRQQLAALLRRRPPWRSGYLTHLVEDGRASPEAVYAMLRLLRLDPTDVFDRRMLGEAVSLLTSRNLVGEARSLVGITGSGVRNGDFESANNYPPLDWKLADEPDLTGVIEHGLREQGGNALFLDARNDASGVVAEQWLSLAPGHHALSLVTGNGDRGSAAPTVEILCGRGAMSLARASLPTGPGVTHAFRLPAFAVPASCPAQRLVISVPASSDVDAGRPWIDDVAVAAAP